MNAKSVTEENLLAENSKLRAQLKEAKEALREARAESNRKAALARQTIADIKDRARVEQALLISEERYRTLFNSLIEGFCIVEVIFDEADAPVDYRFLEVNPVFEAQTGMANSRGKRMRELAPDHESHWFEIYGRIAKTGEPMRFVHEARALNRWFDVSAYRLGGNESRKVAILFNDITDQKVHESKLSESESRFRVMANAMPQLAWIARADGYITWYNQRWYDYTGTTPEQMEGWGWRVLHDDQELERVSLRWNESLATGEPFEMIFPLKGADGSFRPFLTRVFPLKDAAGRVTQWFGTNTDIHELKAAQSEAERLSRAKDDFLAVLSHELRTPLTPVLMAASAMREDESLPQNVREELQMMERNISLEARLIDDLLDLTKITHGKLSFRSRLCDAHSLIGLAIDIVKEEAMVKRISIKREFTAQLRGIVAVPSRFQQVVWNLMRNAVKFTPKGGAITVRTTDKPGPEGGSLFEFTVADSGIGIDPQKQAFIFRPFEQGAVAGDRRYGGIGLGLTIAKAIVDLHGGHIYAESEGENRGTTFHVEIPGAVEAPLGADGKAESIVENFPPKATGGKGHLLLLVEDHEPTLKVLSRLLVRAGYEVIPARTVSEALAAAGTQPVEFLVSDLGLPDGTGTELMRELRDTYGLTGVALSGYGMETDVSRSLEAGFLTHLTKPVDFRLLASALNDLVRNRNGNGRKLTT